MEQEIGMNEWGMDVGKKPQAGLEPGLSAYMWCNLTTRPPVPQMVCFTD